MPSSEWVRGSGRSGASNQPVRETRKGETCPRCQQENIKVYSGELEGHKVYTMKNGKRTSSWKWCTENGNS